MEDSNIDLCQAYRLLQDAGKLVNLGDWFNTFEDNILTPPDFSLPALQESRSKRSRRKREEDSEDSEDDALATSDGPDQIKRARFVRAVSELGFLGMIGSTKRKTEHITRVVW